jgi:hypothetical protein
MKENKNNSESLKTIENSNLKKEKEGRNELIYSNSLALVSVIPFTYLEEEKLNKSLKNEAMKNEKIKNQEMKNESGQFIDSNAIYSKKLELMSVMPLTDVTNSEGNDNIVFITEQSIPNSHKPFVDDDLSVSFLSNMIGSDKFESSNLAGSNDKFESSNIIGCENSSISQSESNNISMTTPIDIISTNIPIDIISQSTTSLDSATKSSNITPIDNYIDVPLPSKSFYNTPVKDQHVDARLQTNGYFATVKSSPFKSPVTENIVNLRQKSKKLIDSYELEDVFSNYKHKRKSSKVAEESVKRREEKREFESKHEEIIKTPFERLFCEISKENAKENSIKNTNFSRDLPLKLGILCDRTNSPVKSTFCNKKLKENDVSGFINKNYFLLDDFNENNMELPENDCVRHDDINTIFKGDGITLIKSNDANITRNDEIISKNDDITRNDILESPAASSRSIYLKEKYYNTKLNEGYKTIITKRRSIIDLFSCPKTHFRNDKKTRKVFFDFNPVLTVHNGNEIINPIYDENQTQNTSFEWNGEKDIVEIVKRIELCSDASEDEFIFKKLDKKIKPIDSN